MHRFVLAGGPIKYIVYMGKNDERGVFERLGTFAQRPLQDSFQ